MFTKMKNSKINKSFAFIASFVMIANIAFVTPAKAVAPSVIFTDSFAEDVDFDIPNWVDGGGDNVDDTYVTTGTPRTGSVTVHNARLRDGGYIEHTINTSGFQNINLQYYWRGDNDGDGESDTFKVFWKKTSDSSYILLNSYRVDDSNIWSGLVSVNLPAEANNTSIDIKFLGDSNADSEEVSIDDVSILGQSIPEVEETPENSAMLCSDHIDNDGDELTDDADPDCAPFVETEEVISATQCTLVSGNETQINTGEGYVGATATYTVPDWTNVIPDATWVWSSYNVVDPLSVTVVNFEHKFTATSTPSSLILTVAADNNVNIRVNGNLVGDNVENSFGMSSLFSQDISSYVTLGLNTLSFEVTNTTFEGATPESNPAGLLYRLDAMGTGCVMSGMNTAPVITLSGANPLTLTVGTPYPMNDFHAHDLEDGDVTGLVTIFNPMTFVIGPGAINTNIVGTYTIVYGVKDSGGLSAVNVTRTVHVVPAKESGNTAPTIALIGNSPMEITAGTSFVEPGVTANDLEDGSIPFPSSKIVVTGSVDTNTVGTYTLTYTVTDNGGLTASIQRTVNVVSVVPAVTGTTGGRSGGRRGGGGGGSSAPQVLGASTVNTGEVLGASTCAYLNDYLKKGWKNDLVEMLKLKTFLNIFEKENLALTGDFDAETFNAVSRFQSKYKSDILIPWDNKEDSTGFVYILTKKKINEIFCNTTITLSPIEKTEVENFVK